MTIEPPFGAPNIKSFPNEVSRETGAMRDASRSGAGLAFGHKNGGGAKVRANGYGVFAEGILFVRAGFMRHAIFDIIYTFLKGMTL